MRFALEKWRFCLFQLIFFSLVLVSCSAPPNSTLSVKEIELLHSIGVDHSLLTPEQIDRIKPHLAPYLELEMELIALADSMAGHYPEIQVEYVDGVVRFSEKPIEP